MPKNRSLQALNCGWREKLFPSLIIYTCRNIFDNVRSRYLAFAIVPKQAVYTRIATILQNNLTLIFINTQINYNLKNFVLINI
jgi:hypothetical protein